MPITERVLTRDELNRALLARNLLLERSPLPVAAMVGHLVALQAQEPQEPYVGLHSRSAAPDPDGASRLLEDRVLVRTLMMRRTQHLLAADDALALRGLHQPMLEQRGRNVLGRRMPDVDEDELREAGRPLFDEAPRQVAEVGRAVGHRWPHVAPRDLGDALSSLLPLVQVPPRGLWRQVGPARCTTYRSWLGRDPEPVDGQGAVERVAALVLRYLAAFGPAASADVRSWSGLTGLPAAIALLGPDLVRYRDERGRVLLDLPGAVLPDPGTPAPPRFLPAFDNAVLAYDDRTRVIDDAHKHLSVEGARYVLVDGRVAATWTTGTDGDGTVLTIAPLAGLVRRDDVDAEADRLLDLLAAPGTARRVVWQAA